MSKQDQRFWDHVSKSECYQWDGARDKNGYGRYKVNGKNVKAHRYAWELTNGPIPKGKVICHKCDNPKCVRSEHLFVGTMKDNQQDMARKGRATRPAVPVGVLKVRTVANRLSMPVKDVYPLIHSGWLRAWYRRPDSHNLCGVTEISVQLFEAVQQ